MILKNLDFFARKRLLYAVDYFLILISCRIPAEKILPYGLNENFWLMGDIGPCGPCTEIHFSRHGCSEKSASLINVGGPDVIELWNLVFMQFDRWVYCMAFLLMLNTVSVVSA